MAAYFGDLVRANREGLKTLGSWSSEMQVTIESADRLIILTEINEHFVCTCSFDRDVPLGMARLHLKKVLDRVRTVLPTFDVEEKPRGARIIDFLNRYAPDPHAVMLRVSLRTGIPIEEMGAPQDLSDEQVAAVESATKRILGLQSLSV
ncbi:MAG: hypothetical protein KDD47_14190 [Acidobacteria bacterium]|nr:hypothetical protein [Acidobacteriota bacterium]